MYQTLNVDIFFRWIQTLIYRMEYYINLVFAVKPTSRWFKRYNFYTFIKQRDINGIAEE